MKYRIEAPLKSHHIVKLQRFIYDFLSYSSDKYLPKTSSLRQYLQTGSGYNSANGSKRQLNDRVLEVINKCLEENTAKRLDGRSK